jgi:hypothetical protein
LSSADGIWHPDSLSPIMAWKGGECSLDDYAEGNYFDPFAAYGAEIARAQAYDFTGEWLYIYKHVYTSLPLLHPIVPL